MSPASEWKWVATNSPTANSRTDDIWFFDEQKGWLVNSNGQVSQTLDGGETWTMKKFIDPNSKGFPYLRCMGWANERIGWVGAVTVFDAGNKDYLQVLLHRTTDGGASWENMSNMPDSSPAGICGMFAVNEKIVYGAGTNDPDLPGPGLVKTTDGGLTWTHTDLSQHADNLIDVYFFDENTGWIVGGKKQSSCPAIKPGYETHPQYSQLKPVVLKTTDGGATWVNKAAGVDGFDCGEWGWKIQFLDARTGFVALENFSTAAILKTSDGGETWVRLPIVDAAGRPINMDLEGVGFIDGQSGWVGGWADNFEGLFNSLTVDGGKSWTAQNNVPGNPATDPRIRINRYRFLGSPISKGYCSGAQVYKRAAPGAPTIAMAAARRATPQPAGLALSHTANFSSRSVEITYVLPQDAASVFVGIWNHFAFHVRTLVDGRSLKAGRHTITWDGTDDSGKPLGGDLYICRMSVDGRTGESQTVRLPK
ncbi:YCF48-related protein [Bradyrhizobium sp. CCBAU 51753]|uniref:YCF48-related protein n=1 Tax=Bradyrhizobium sp. CCBAU 51753 TaxID=1325100 RepID=UPI00188C3D89|nr:YCF48-related protein [Bradyrhizobium sp. CCBAU 51753]QOZ23454.1 hypothetical protein XH93_07185 [Bradyrhizobium sp. CCBAU 51753]